MPGKYYVHHLSSPPAVYGPYNITTAKQYARIGAKPGYDDRMITRGIDGPVIRVYHDGERIWPVTKKQTKGLTKGEMPPALKRTRNPKRSSKRLKVRFWQLGSGVAADPVSSDARKRYLKKLVKKYGERVKNEPVIYLSKKGEAEALYERADLSPSEIGQIKSDLAVVKMIPTSIFSSWVRTANGV